MNTVFIYALNCPTTGRTRYVGKANDPAMRFRQHLNDARKSNHRTNWVRFLLAQDKKPILEILDEVPAAEWQQWEVAYIEFFREEGFDLVNGTEGGMGGRGGRRSPEFCEQMRRIHLGKPKSEEHRAKLSVANKGKVFSEERCEQISLNTSGENNGMFGKHHSPETKAKISAKNAGHSRNLGRRPSPEQIAKTRAANLGRKHTPEARANMSLAGKGKKRKPFSKEHLENMSKSQLGKKHTPEACANMGASRKGKKRGPYKKKEVLPSEQEGNCS